MHYCGFCGAPLEHIPSSGDGGNSIITCPSCGATISGSDDVVPFGAMETMPDAVRARLTSPERANLSAQPVWPVPGQSDSHRRLRNSRRISGGMLAPLILAALALLLICGSTLVLGNNAGGLHLPGLSSGLSASQQTKTALASSTGAHRHATASPQSTALPSPTGSPLDATPGLSTPEVDGTATAIAAAGQPALAVAPHEIRITVCAAATTQFTVMNTGGGVMAWSANASNNSYTISPSSGSLGRGEHETVTVSNIALSGQVTVDAPGATNTPQTVTITCGL